jgi:chromosome segregation ATPase
MKIDNLEKEVSNGVKVGIIPNIKGQIKTLTQQIYNYDVEDISHTLGEWRARQDWATELKNAKEELIKMEEQLEDFQKEYENLKELVDQYYLEEDGVLKYWNKAVYQQPD